MAETFIVVNGILWIGFALFHAMFWKIFDWKNELPRLSPPNRMIVQASNVILIYIFIVLGIVYVAYAGEISTSALGHVLLLAALGFWVLRTVLQFVFGSVKSRASNMTAGICAVMAIYSLMVFAYGAMI
jgi:hypothetical protein